jgi:hypothetical protein
MILAGSIDLSGSNLAELASIVGAFLFLITTVLGSVLAVNWRKARESEHLAALKQSLADKGMSADDIERIMRAGPERKKPGAALPVTALSEVLVYVNGISPQTLEEIVQVFQTSDPATQNAIVQALSNMVENDNLTGDHYLAMVRGLAHPAAAQKTAQNQAHIRARA